MKLQDLVQGLEKEWGLEKPLPQEIPHHTVAGMARHHVGGEGTQR